VSSDEVHAFPSEVSRGQRLDALQTRVTRVRALRDQLASELEAKERELEYLSSRLAILAKVSELYLMLMDRMVKDQIKAIDEIVTHGFQTIFFDQNLRFETELGSKYNKISAEFFVCDGDPNNGGTRGDPMESYGGGPAVIASLILRILTLLRLKRRKFLLLDETLFAVSDDYVENTSLFLKGLAQNMGLDIFLVTHKQSYVDYAPIAYHADTKIEEGRNHLTLRRARGLKNENQI
jgi:hypothetical protein